MAIATTAESGEDLVFLRISWDTYEAIATTATCASPTTARSSN